MTGDIPLDASFSSAVDSVESFHSGQLKVKNTFLTVEEPKERPMRRCNSGSDLSLSSLPRSGTQTPPSSVSGSGRNTPVSWADIYDDDEDADGPFGEGDNDFQDLGKWSYPTPTVEAVELYEKLQDVAKGRGLPDKILAELAQDDTIKQHIPRDPQGNLSSLGSISHCIAPIGEKCKPCLFLLKNRCAKGHLCLHCHIPHPNFKGKRMRASKATRQRRANMFQDSLEGQKKNEDRKGGYASSNASSYSSGSRSGSNTGSTEPTTSYNGSQGKKIISL